MRKTFLKTIGFMLIVAAIVAGNLWVFRSDYPLLWFATSIGSVVALILFPYKPYFNNFKQK